MTAREALRLATRGGAEVLRRDDIGSLEPGKQADLAIWATDGLELGGADDPVAGLVFRARTGSTGWSSAARTSCGGALVRPTRRRSLAPIGPRREDSRRELLALDARARHRRGQARGRSHGRARGPGGTLATAGARQRRRARLAEDLAAGTYRLVFHPPSPFFTRVELQVELAEGHYHVPLLVSPVRVLFRCRATAAGGRLAAEELAELLRGADVPGSPRRAARRSGARIRSRARTLVHELPADEKREILDAHPAIGAASRPLRALGRRAGG